MDSKMTEQEKELELSEYLEKWIRDRYTNWHIFYNDVCTHKKNGIYMLEGGHSLMNLLDNIMGNIEGHLSLPDETSHLIPTQFASVSAVIAYLEWLKNIVDKYKPTIEKNIHGKVIDNYIISELCTIIGDIDQMVDRCVKVYKDDPLPWPYHLCRSQLFNKDVCGFVESVNCILKDVPYLSRKKKFNEGHFQTMLQLLLMVLGFEPLAEKVISDGRIDMVVKLEDLTYIFEFKYTNGERSQAKAALKQIKDKGYADPFRLTSREIIAVGVSFSGQTKNINGYNVEKLL